MFQTINKVLQKPSFYQEMEVPFWDDTYISKQMLKAHLDPDTDGASRKLAFIEKSVAWIEKKIPPKNNPFLLDIGCGPGIYAEKFTQAGFQVTGIDFSKRSIDYAKNSAAKKAMNITYLYQNYLFLKLDSLFDFAVMIYCDYGVLSTENRKILLKNIYHHLKPGGKLLLDVFSITKYNQFKQQQTWEIQQNGFWREGEYLVLNGNYKYPNHVTLEQISVISNNSISNYYLWNTYFTKETFLLEASQAGFKLCEIYSNIAGTSYEKTSPTLAILLEK